MGSTRWGPKVNPVGQFSAGDPVRSIENLFLGCPAGSYIVTIVSKLVGL